MPQRPNILYLTHRVPYPPNRGDRIRSYHTLRCLAQYANVYLATLTDEPLTTETIDELDRLCKRVEIAPLGREHWLRAAWSLARGKSATAGNFQSPRLARTIRRWAREVSFDSVLVFCSGMFPYSELPELAGRRRVVDLVDVDSQKWFDYAGEASLAKRWLYWAEGRQVRFLETRIAMTSDAVTLVSPQEADLFREVVPGGSVHAVTNGVDLDYFHPEAVRATVNAHECVFVGVLDYRANVQGLHWFCRSIWPEVIRSVPDARFTIVGRRPVESVMQLGDMPGVKVVGEVADVRPYVARAAVVVAPLRVARGIQNKVLEGMAMGKAVVATPQALEGLAVVREDDVLQAGNAPDWCDAIVKLFTDLEARQRLEVAARRYVERHHSWSACLAELPILLKTKDSDRVERRQVLSQPLVSD